jgi:hypothetical protein
MMISTAMEQRPVPVRGRAVHLVVDDARPAERSALRTGVKDFVLGLGLIVLLPVVILVVGAPIAFVVRLVMALAERW